MRPRTRRSHALSLALALFLAPAAQATVLFKGFSAKRTAQLRADLGKSLFPFSSLLNVTVKPGDLPEGALGLASSDGVIVLDGDAFASDEVRAFALFHELAHQIDYQVLARSERGRYYEAAGFGKSAEIGDYADTDWYDEALDHHRIPAEQFASAVPLVVWPAEKGNTFVGEDGTCIGWENGEGCRAPLDVVTSILNAVLARKGLPAMAVGTESEPLVETFVPPRSEAPSTRTLRTTDAGVPAVATSLSSLAALDGASPAAWQTLRIRLSGPGGALPGATVVLDYKDNKGWWQLAELSTDKDGEISYRFRPKGWTPTAFRVTFTGVANLAGATLTVPVGYAAS
jgi:hypothetical protein